MPELQPPHIDESDYSRLLAGHLGHLTPSQEKSLETFKQSLHKADLYNPKVDDSGHPSHDDTTLLCVYNLQSLPGLFTPSVGTADSSVPGGLTSVKRTSSLPIPSAGGWSTMWRIYIRHSTRKRWSRQRGSTLDGPAGEIR